jgi:hypothetical protein
MIIKMKLFAVFCLAFVMSACGSTNSVEWPATPIGMTKQEFLNAFGDSYNFAVTTTTNVAVPTHVSGSTRTVYRVTPLFEQRDFASSSDWGEVFSGGARVPQESRYYSFIGDKLTYMPGPTEIAAEARRAAEAARIAQAQVVTLPELFQNFADNPLRADANYSNKPVRVTGVLRNFESFWGEYYFVEIGGAGVIESFRDRSLIILLGRLSPLTTSTYPGLYDSDRRNWLNKADEIKESLINLTIGETYTFYCESPSKQLLSDTMNRIYEVEQELAVRPPIRQLRSDSMNRIYEVEQERTARPITRWLREKQGLAEQNRAYLCTKGEVIQ